MIHLFPEPRPSGERVQIELDLSNYAAKADLKNEKCVGTSKCARKVNLANLKSNVDKIDIDKLKNIPNNLSNLKSKMDNDKLDVDNLVPLPVDLSKLIDIVKSEAVQIDAYNTKIKNIEDKIPAITNLATNTTLNGKISEVKSKISNITNLPTTAAFNAKTSKVKKS